ncbi:MAG TPA: TlyA family RNA methyltransferase [bacterium]|nr:TlyA family RNA methyltransferase [bacterium]
MPSKERLDMLLVARDLAPSREKAKAMIMAGEVLVDDRPVTKAGTAVAVDAAIRLRRDERRFASRGGDKLLGALEAFAVDPAGQRWLDVGQSTGGFTDLLLQRDAAHVTGLDVGYGQLDLRLRNDPRVTCRERVNVRHLPDDFFNGELFDGAVIDVSFISLKFILPVVAKHLRAGASVVALVKPQFEAGREQVGKGGLVKDDAVIAACVDNVFGYAREAGLSARGQIPSPVTGAKGNREVFVLLHKDEP